MEKFDFSKQPGKQYNREPAGLQEDVLVTVITAYYNAGKYFEQTFCSVMNQTFPWFEWIIVDDGSTDHEDVDLLHRLGNSDQRIQIVTQKNGGLSCARNTAIAHSRTDLIVPLDADDLIAPTYLECLYWSLYYHPEAAWSYSSSYGFHDQEYIWKYPFNAEKLKTYNFLNYTAMIRKKDIQDIGGYKVEKQAYYEDWRFWLEMLSHGKRPIHVNTCLFWYRRLESGMLSSINQDPERVKFCKEIIREAARDVPGDIQILEYPVRRSQYEYYMPRLIPWTRSSYGEHERKRLLWLIPWMNMGGADRFNLEAVSGLKGLGYDSFILTTQPGENEWRQRFEEYTDEIFCLPDFLDPSHYPEFVSYYLQSREIDAVIITNSYEGYYMAPWLRQHFPDIPIIDYVHMEEWYWRAGGYARISGVLSGVLEKTYVCNSNTGKVLTEYFGRDPESVKCLYIGVDQSYYDPKLEKEGYLHQLLKLKEDRPIVLFPCRIHPQKRPFLMLKIAEKVRKQIPDIVFVVAGDGPQLEELKRTIRERKLEETVYCIGAVQEMRACYCDSMLTLICSLKEGLALTAYESLSMGVPVVSSDVGGQRDLIGPDVGALVPVWQTEEKDFDNRIFAEGEAELYAAHIVRLMRDSGYYQELSKRGREKIEDNFTKDKMIKNLHEELQILSSDEILLEKRRGISDALKIMSGFAADYYTTFQQWGIKNEECEMVWQERCWFENLWKSEKEPGKYRGKIREKLKGFLHR